MIAAFILTAFAQQLTSKAVYDEIQAKLAGLKSIRYSFGPPVIDSGQSPTIVTFRKPNQFNISATGLTIVSDGKWYLETGEQSETQLRKSTSADLRLYGPGLETIVSPGNSAIPTGNASEVPLPWNTSKSVTKIELGYPALKGTMTLYVDRATKLPVGFVFPDSQFMAYHEIIPDVEIKDLDLRIAPPPTMAACLSRIKGAQSSKERFEFDLRLDFKKPWEKIVLEGGKSSKPGRDLFGFEDYLGKKTPIAFEGLPTLCKFGTTAWMIRGHVPGSKKEIRVFFDWKSYLPLGYEFWMDEEPVRHAEYSYFDVISAVN